MKRTPTSAALPLTVLAAGLALLAPGAARAAAPTAYKIQPIVKLGDPVADVTIKAGGDFEVGALNDSGQIALVTENAAGGEMLLQYAGGKFIPIAVGGRDAPGGKWSKGGIDSPVSMNQRGDIAFVASATIGGKTDNGTFRWDYQAQKATLVGFKGMPAVRNLTFQSGGYWLPTINNQGGIAFPAAVKNAAGAAYYGVFLRSPDGQLQAVALPDDPLPDGSKATGAIFPSLNDAGLVAFITQRSGDKGNSAYLWEKGAITPVLLAGSAAPDGSKITTVKQVWVNNQNRNVLVAAEDTTSNSLEYLYLWSNGTLTPVAVPGQAMPGGGQFKGIFDYTGTTSAANEAGQHAFIAQLQDNSTAAYRMEADGTLSLILKSGTTTDLGLITRVGEGTTNSMIAFNSAGQAAFAVRIAGSPTTLVLLTPSAP